MKSIVWIIAAVFWLYIIFCNLSKAADDCFNQKRALELAMTDLENCQNDGYTFSCRGEEAWLAVVKDCLNDCENNPNRTEGMYE